MKTLTVYIKDSFHKYPDLYKFNRFEINEYKELVVHQTDMITGEEYLVAQFRTWDYFLIEEDNER